MDMQPGDLASKEEDRPALSLTKRGRHSVFLKLKISDTEWVRAKPKSGTVLNEEKNMTF